MTLTCKETYEARLSKIVSLIIDCLRSGNKVLVFGVGGNAANAVHFAAELAGKYERYSNPLPCIDLCSNPSVLSAIATDFGWEHVFQRQVKALAKPGDVVIAFSISTNGDYLRNALEQAILSVCSGIILICGRVTRPFNPSMLKWYTIYELDSDNTPMVQEEQLKLIHKICGEVKEKLADA